MIGHRCQRVTNIDHVWKKPKWMVGNSNIFEFSPRYLGKWSNVTNIFQMGWNQQLAKRGHHDQKLWACYLHKWRDFIFRTDSRISKIFVFFLGCNQNSSTGSKLELWRLQLFIPFIAEEFSRNDQLCDDIVVRSPAFIKIEKKHPWSWYIFTFPIKINH